MASRPTCQLRHHSPAYGHCAQTVLRACEPRFKWRTFQTGLARRPRPEIRKRGLSVETPARRARVSSTSLFHETAVNIDLRRGDER
jgi:hypothetical protein